MRHIVILAFLALALAGCGPVMSDTTATTTTAGAELAQHDNHPVCAGVIVLGSCNTTATQTQTTSRPAVAPGLPAGDVDVLAVVVNAALIAAAITALFLLLALGLRAIYASSDEGAY